MEGERELAARFGENLIQRRKRAGLSQETLGFLAGLHRTEIGMLERGTRLPRIDTLLKLAGALEIEPGSLLAGMTWLSAIPQAGHFRASGAPAGDGS